MYITYVECSKYTNYTLDISSTIYTTDSIKKELHNIYIYESYNNYIIPNMTYHT